MTVINELIDIVRGLAENPAVRVTGSDADLFEGGEDRIDKLWESLTRRRGTLPAVLREMIRIADKLGVAWQSADKGDNAVSGEFMLRSPLLMTAANLMPEADHKFEQIDPDVDMRNVREFDFYARSGGPIHALLRVADGTIEDRIYVYNEEEGAFRTELSCASYLRELCRTRGLFYWQLLFREDRAIGHAFVTPLEQGLDFLEATFREDCADLRTRLREARKLR